MRDAGSSSADKAPSRLKLVVRGLPWTLSVDAFREVLGQSLLAEVFYLDYVQGKQSISRHSVAHMGFSNTEGLQDVAKFLDGKVFIDNKGREQSCSVEYAPFQLLRSVQKPRDELSNTFEQDPEYVAFCESCNKPPPPPMSAEKWLEERE
eukprot:RCo023751